ncbi:MAG: ABC transporter ATP-binding protein [Pseudomonadales bacterium]|nr:ABC transporter ATP-binding protein [Pseudomonadales bacterium]
MPMNIIELHNLTYSWPKQRQLSINIKHFSLQQGQKLFIKGRSGSGKSTLLNLLTGIIPANPGSSIKVLGQQLSELSSASRDKFRADHIGYIFQQFNLIPYLSVIENVLLPCRFSSRRADSIKTDSRLQARKLLTNLKLSEKDIYTPVTSLSIGQQQRVAAARALIGSPELIIADESSSALDHDNRNAFIELLMQECHNSGATLIFVSHDPSLESLFDRSVQLQEINLQGIIR